jgi:hypothetical protein
MGCAMKKQAISMGLFLMILVSSLACDASGVVTPTAGIPSTPEIATLASIAFNAPVPTIAQVAPVATVAPAAAGTLIAPVRTNITVTPIKTGSPTPTATAVPNSRSNPVPAGSVFQVDDLQLFVSNITRPADGIVQSGNALNFSNEAGAGKEYMFVKVGITCEKPADQECILSVYNFKALGSDAVLINPEITIAGVDGLLTSTIFYGGATKTGNIPYIVTKGDANIQLVYQTSLGDKVYLALPAN